MGKDPSMPFYVNDWLSSTRIACMTLEQQGAYLRLLCYCWASQDASLPSDEQQLAALSGMGQGWLKGGCQMVADCFVPHPNREGCLTNPRLFELWEERQEWRRKSSEGGKKSAARRARLRTSGKPKGGSTTPATKGQPNGNSSSSSSSSSSLLNPLTPFAYKGGTIEIPPDMNSAQCRQALLDWMDFKRSKGQAYKTSRSLQTAVRKWDRDIGAAQFPLAVEASIANNYAGLFPDKPNGSTNGQKLTRNQQREANNAAAFAAVFGQQQDGTQADTGPGNGDTLFLENSG